MSFVVYCRAEPRTQLQPLELAYDVVLAIGQSNIFYLLPFSSAGALGPSPGKERVFDLRLARSFSQAL